MSSSDVIGEATVSTPDTEIVLRIDLAAQEVTGELLVGGRPACPFRSWVELVTALDRALDTLRAPSAKN